MYTSLSPWTEIESVLRPSSVVHFVPSSRVTDSAHSAFSLDSYQQLSGLSLSGYRYIPSHLFPGLRASWTGYLSLWLSSLQMVSVGLSSLINNSLFLFYWFYLSRSQILKSWVMILCGGLCDLRWKLQKMSQQQKVSYCTLRKISLEWNACWCWDVSGGSPMLHHVISLQPWFRTQNMCASLMQGIILCSTDKHCLRFETIGCFEFQGS